MTARQRHYLRQSKTSLWLTPLSCALFLGIAWLIGRVLPVPTAVYWIIIAVLGFTWLADLLNVFWLRRAARREV